MDDITIQLFAMVWLLWFWSLLACWSPLHPCPPSGVESISLQFSLKPIRVHYHLPQVVMNPNGFQRKLGFFVCVSEDLVSSLTETLAQSRLDETKDEVLVLYCSYVASCCALIPKLDSLNHSGGWNSACLFSWQILYKSHNWKSKG